MGEETITVGNVSAGTDVDAAVELPVVDVLTGRGFITGKSGSGKSNSASVVCEKLLDSGYGILIVDIDGEYYGLKEEYEILHVGADEECDLRVGVEHAGKIAELALQQNVPIILDVSSFLDESKARELLTEVTKQLFAKEKKLKQPFLMLVEEVHEYIPEGGGVDECGRMLIKVSKRGRKHGLGIVGISQRPADVKKDFITQCDWLVWHRLTWNNDTKVVGRILGGEYADVIEEMDDGESFLMTDWNESIRRVQFERKRTFDAGATPGLEDFERPELKSVSGDLVDELQEITDEQNQRENRIEELERELQRKEERIGDLERQLSEARDLKQMADRFSRAMMEQVTGRPLSVAPGRQCELDEAVSGPVQRDPKLEADLEAVRNGDREPTPPPVPDAESEWEANATDRPSGDTTTDEKTEDKRETASTGSTDVDNQTGDVGSEIDSDPSSFPESSGSIEGMSDPDSEASHEGTADGPSRPGMPNDASGRSDEPSTDRSESVGTPREPIVSRLQSEIEALEEIPYEMLKQYRRYGPATPQECHAAAGGSGDRGPAYAMNRRLRQLGLVDHIGCGQYDYALGALVREELTDPIRPERSPDEDTVAELVSAIERATLEGGSADGETEDGPTSAMETDADESRTESELEPWPEL